MRKMNLVFSFFILFTFSCNKEDISELSLEDKKIKLLEELNGSYTGNIYNWKRDYDSTHMNVIETFDTILKVKSVLEINVTNNSIRFNNELYPNHANLDLLLDEDTIIAASGWNYPTSMMIVKSHKFIRLHYMKFAVGSPWAISKTEEYFKD